MLDWLLRMTAKPAPTVARISTPADVISAIPIFVGFHPIESLVVMCLHGPKNRNGLTLRVDLPTAEHVEPLAKYVVATVAQQDPNAVISVCYTDSPDDDGRLPYDDLVHQILRDLSGQGIGYLHALLARGERWWCYDTDHDCPDDGEPLPDAPSGEITALEARRVMDGRTVFESRAAMEASVAGPTALREIGLLQACERACDACITELGAGDGKTVVTRTLEMAREAYHRHRENLTLDDEEAVRIIVGLHDKRARDALLTWGVDDDSEDFLSFLNALARCAPDPFAAPICTVLAGVAYAGRQGGLTAVAIERALRSDPGYTLADMLANAYQRQVPPDAIRDWLASSRESLEIDLDPSTGKDAA